MVRRIGVELDHALLDAGWQQLVEEGYAAFTMDAVAARAGTSRAVLYRRWANKHELVRAVVAHIMRPDELTLADTGTLRGDTIAMLKLANRTRLELVTAMTVHLGGYYQETGTSPTDLRKTLFPNRPHLPRLLLDRAIARGEVHPVLVTDRIAALPYALLQQEFFMTLKPAPNTVIEEIVDTIFLPLVKGPAKHR
ncbi:MAG TPA: TetR/AcrR family transcriptional regulator [Polyangiaceae bacterium]|jgi:AcrR family transcriptional regulator|nr:TetR/AcrR family transcriptional regulator [Polyangiaceae bacterium]